MREGKDFGIGQGRGKAAVPDRAKAGDKFLQMFAHHNKDRNDKSITVQRSSPEPEVWSPHGTG